jgi:hypothetical protein
MGLIVCSQLRALTELGHKWKRLLAWIGDQVRLKAFSAQQRALYTRGGIALYLNRDNSEPIKGKLKHKRTIRRPETIRSYE